MHGPSDFLDYEPVTRPRGKEPTITEAGDFQPPISKGGSNYDHATIRETKENEASGSLSEKDIAAAESLTNSRTGENKKWLQKRGHAISYAGLFLFTLILYLRPYEMFSALASFKSMAFYVGVATLLVFIITQISIGGNLTIRPREVNLVLMLGVAALFSIPLAINPGEAWMNFSEIYIKSLVIFIVLANVVRTERRLNLLLLLVLAVSVYLSIGAIQDYRSGLFLAGKLDNSNLRIVGRIKGLFENSNDLALHLVSMVPVAFGLAFAKRGLARKLIYLTSGGLMIGAVVATFSRGGFLGLIAIAGIFVFKVKRSNRVTAMAGLGLAIVLFLALAPGEYGGRISTIFDSGADLTGSSSQRTQVLQRSVLVALRHPLFGVGIGNFHHQSFQELGTHNAYTQVGTEMGLAAMVVYIMFLLAPLKRLREVEREAYDRPADRRFYYLAIGLQTSILAFMVSSFFGAVAYQWYPYYLVGYALSLHRLFLSRPDSGEDRKANARSILSNS